MLIGRLTTSPGLYAGLTDGLLKIGRSEGFRGLYKNLHAANAWAIPYYGCELFLYDWLKNIYARSLAEAAGGGQQRRPDRVATLLIGGVSGICCTTLAYPMEMIRRKLQTQGVSGRPVLYSGIADCASQVLREQGVRGLFAGLVPNLVKAPFSVGIMFLVYEEILRVTQVASF